MAQRPDTARARPYQVAPGQDAEVGVEPLGTGRGRGLGEREQQWRRGLVAEDRHRLGGTVLRGAQRRQLVEQQRAEPARRQGRTAAALLPGPWSSVRK
ncbi:hypothetical protein GCM10020254_61300 [Streptomyces goshikiensis]